MRVTSVENERENKNKAEEWVEGNDDDVARERPTDGPASICVLRCMLVLARRSQEERAVRPIYIEGGTRNGSRRHEGRQQ